MNDTLLFQVNTSADTVLSGRDSLDLGTVYFSGKERYLIMQKDESAKLSSLRSLISAQSGKKTLQPEYYNRIDKDWISILLIFCFIIFAWINFLYRKRLKQIIKAFFTGRFVNQLIRDGNILRERLAIPLTIIFFITISLFTYYIMFFSGFGNLEASADRKNFIYIFFAFVLAWFIKVAGIKFIGKLFKVVDFTSDYLLVNYIINFITGLMLFPLIVFTVYLESKLTIIITSFLLSAVFFFWIFRGLFIGLSNPKISLFYYFLYLCTVEILPFILVLKGILIVMQITVG